MPTLAEFIAHLSTYDGEIKVSIRYNAFGDAALIGEKPNGDRLTFLTSE